MIEISLEGFDKIMDLVDPVRFVGEMDRAVDRAASVIRDETKRLPPVNSLRTGYAAKGIPVAPKYGGTLRQSIQKRKLGLMAANVYAGVSYADYVHDGTARMPARPFFRWMLEDFGGKDMIEIVIRAALDRVTSP